MAKKSRLPKSLTTVTPFSKVLALLIFIALIFAAYYVGVRYKEKSITADISYPSPTLTVNAPTKVTTVPIHHADFEKAVVISDQCRNPVGLVSYRDKKGERTMKINNLELSGTTESREGLRQIVSFLQKSNLVPFKDDLQSFESPFRNYCSGALNMFIKELPGISYPGTDEVRAALFYTTQSTFGTTSVIVLAQKGNDVVQLSKYMDRYVKNKEIYDSLQNKCDSHDDKKIQKDEKCYQQQLISDPALQKAAEDEAQQLISTFALQ